MIGAGSDAAWAGPYRYSLVRLFVVAALFIAAAPVFWHRTQLHTAGGIPAAYENADLYQEVYPSFHYGFGRVRAGELPLWNSKQLCGTPFQANPASGLFQPLNLVFALLPTEQAMALHAFVCLAVMGFTFVLFARSLGAGFLAAWIGGVAYAFCGASAAAISRPALANALAWTPLVFWTLREYGRRFRFGGAIAAGLAAALVLLSGATALAFMILFSAVPYAILVCVFPRTQDPPGLRRRIEGLVVAGLVAAAVAAIQWVPALAWAWSLDRPWDALWSPGLPGQFPATLQEIAAQLIAPKPGPLPRVGYLGVIALLAIPAALFHKDGWLDAWYFVAAAVALFLGSISILGQAPLGFPANVLAFPAMFCLAVLAALGFDRLLHTRRATKPLRVWGPAAIVTACAGALFYLSAAEPRGRIVIFVLLVVPAVVLRARVAGKICGTAVAILLFVDLVTASVNVYSHPFENAPACYQRYAKTVAAAEEQALDSRLAVSAPPLDFGMPADLAMILPSACGAGGLAPPTRDQAVWWRRLRAEESADTALQSTPDAAMPGLLNVMAVRALLAAPASPMYAGAWQHEGPRLREVRTGDDARLFLNDAAVPRVTWVPFWRMTEGVAAAADAIGAPGFDATRECTIDRDSEGYAEFAQIVPGPRDPAQPAPAPAPDAACSMEEITAERVVVHLTAPQPGIVVLADTYASGWKATLDGAPCPILRANGLFRGIATPPGGHWIVFEYQPWPFRVGLAVTIAALAVLMLSGLVAFVRG